jgi:hypothetical protein
MNGFGQDFDDFMVEQGLYDEAKELAAKKLLAFALQREMGGENLAKRKAPEPTYISRACSRWAIR